MSRYGDHTPKDELYWEIMAVKVEHCLSMAEMVAIVLELCADLLRRKEED